MEAARLLAAAGAKPRRTIVFALWAAEEFGLLGSKHFVENNPGKLPNIVNVFNRDGGPMPYTSFAAPVSFVKEYEKAAEYLREIYPDYPLTISELKPRKVPTRVGGNDETSFDVKGVPTLQMGEWEDVKGHNFSYYEIWHTERDTYQKSIAEYQQQAAAAWAIWVLHTANLPSLLPRNEVYSAE
jgi:Zn-dependent M28 family amino/carboxypeptidase